MEQLINWLLQQGSVVVVVVMSMLGFFRYIVPVFTRQQERHETVLHAQIQEHRERADKHLSIFTDTNKELAAAHERGLHAMAQAHKESISELIRELKKS